MCFCRSNDAFWKGKGLRPYAVCCLLCAACIIGNGVVEYRSNRKYIARLLAFCVVSDVGACISFVCRAPLSVLYFTYSISSLSLSIGVAAAAINHGRNEGGSSRCDYGEVPEQGRRRLRCPWCEKTPNAKHLARNTILRHLASAETEAS